MMTDHQLIPLAALVVFAVSVGALLRHYYRRRARMTAAARAAEDAETRDQMRVW